jgi:hypothetical protein
MRESLMYGSVRGTRGNSRPYRDGVTALHESGIGTKRARAYATDVRSWWKLTYERLEAFGF